jgi:hypothetical protein
MQRRLKDAFGVATPPEKSDGTKLLVRGAACGAVDGQMLVDGRDKPGYDAAL